MELHVTKNQLGALVPADAPSREAVRKLEAGEYYKVSLVKPRHGKFHRLFFALLNVVHSNMSDQQLQKWPTTDRLLWEIKLQTGYFQMAESIGGKMYPIPSSISFAAMDDLEFDEFFRKAMTVVQKYFIPGISDAELREAVQNEIGEYS